MKIKIVLFITLFLLNSISLLFGNILNENDLVFKKITQRDGLSQGSISSIIQDSKGFMWFGTQSGLNKYDGYKFEVFYNDTENINTISSNTILDIFEDSRDNIWIGTDNGLNRYNSTGKKFIRYFSNNKKDSISDNTITSICEDENGDIWVGTNNGLNRYNYKKK